MRPHYTHSRLRLELGEAPGECDGPVTSFDAEGFDELVMADGSYHMIDRRLCLGCGHTLVICQSLGSIEAARADGVGIDDLDRAPRSLLRDWFDPEPWAPARIPDGECADLFEAVECESRTRIRGVSIRWDGPRLRRDV